jgi:hypothetical protein
MIGLRSKNLRLRDPLEPSNTKPTTTLCSNFHSQVKFCGDV